MKLLSICTIILALSACGKPKDVQLIKENDQLKIEMADLKIKLEATEAQLLNVSAELSKCKGNDSSTVVIKEP